MAQSNMKLRMLILLATALTIPGGVCEELEMIVESGSVAVLPCVITSPNAHSSEVYWKRINDEKQTTVWRRDKSGLAFRSGDQGTRVHCPVPNFGKGDYSLHIEGVRESDGGRYLCMVERVSRLVMLRVVKVSFTPNKVMEGSMVKMNCNITPQPRDIVNIRWELNGSSQNTEINRGTHTVHYVSQKAAGPWSCVVQHREAMGKASASLQVEGILFPKDNSAVVYADLGSSVTLPCIFSDGLTVNNIFWKTWSDEKRLLPSSSKTPWQRDASAHLDNVQEEDEGLYQCSGEITGADGKSGTVNRYIRLVVVRVLKSSSNGRATLTCQLSNSSQVTHYEWLRWNYGKNGTQMLISVQNSTSSLVSIGQDEADLGEWVCRFYKQQSVLGNITYHLQLTSGLTGHKKAGSNKTAIMLGLGFLLMILLLILLQMYKNHRRRKMLMQYPAMETIVHLAANERERRERSKERGKNLKAACGGDLKSECV